MLFAPGWSSSKGRQAARGIAARPAGVLLAPVLLRQGARVRRTTPVLPEAAGARSGRAGSDQQPPLRLLVVGESTAAGVGVEDQCDGLPRRLAVALSRRCDRVIDWQVRARTGATASAAAGELLAGTTGAYDVVVVVLGVNDALRLRSRSAWRDSVTRVLDVVEPHLAPAGQVLLAGVPDLGAFPALPRPLRTVLGWHAGALDGELRRLAARRPGVVHAPAPALSSDLFATDGFHPNADAYARWAQHLTDHLGAPT